MGGDERGRRYEDQQKVRRAIAVQSVDPADVPAAAKVATPPVMMPGPSSGALAGQKRKHQPDVAGTSQSFSQMTIPNGKGVQNARGTPGDEEDELAPAEPESVDELYCVLKSSIVGVQYYKGT